MLASSSCRDLRGNAGTQGRPVAGFRVYKLSIFPPKVNFVACMVISDKTKLCGGGNRSEKIMKLDYRNDRQIRNVLCVVLSFVKGKKPEYFGTIR